MTAWMEAQQGFPFKPQPTTLVSYQVDCENIADLSDPGVQLAAGTSAVELACPWEDLASRRIDPPTWTLADRLISLGVAGIIVRSFAPGSGPDNLNLIFWSWSEKKPHRITAIDDQGRLPKPPGSPLRK
jgi:RES domain-containing protein